jgi:hypothetical protein
MSTPLTPNCLELQLIAAVQKERRLNVYTVSICVCTSVHVGV